MKAERRHELQTNSLARFLESLPLYFQFHLGKIIFGVLVIVLVVVLVRHRMVAGEVREQEVASQLVAVRGGLELLHTVDLRAATPEQRATERRRVSDEIRLALDEIEQHAQGAENAAMRAEALVARGDLNWILANLPEIPGASTQPAIQTQQSSEQHLSAAQDAYQQVVRDHHDRPMSAVTALFGLAAIAENRGQWDVARAHYDAILARSDTPRLFHATAAERLQLLSVISEPLYMGSLGTMDDSSPTTMPRTLSETLAAPQSPQDELNSAPATQPATQPTTQPVAQPTIQP